LEGGKGEKIGTVKREGFLVGWDCSGHSGGLSGRLCLPVEGDIMKEQIRKTNHHAVAGFLLPFVAAGAGCGWVLFNKGRIDTPSSLLFLLVVVPLILAAGLVFSLRSLPRIKDLGDRDYAYSGLVLNIFFSLIYLGSIIYIVYLLP